MSDEGFLSRWSRRKVERKARQAPDAERPDSTAVAAPPALSTLPVAQTPAAASPQESNVEVAAKPAVADAPEQAVVPKPTLADVEMLTREDSFARFVARDVDPDVRNAAMKKLFSDPRYNVMDGLDIYIEDYGKPDPIPLSMLRQMAQSKALGLFDHEDEEHAAGAPQAETPRSAPQAQTAPQPIAPRDAAAEPRQPETPDDEDPDLQLQPDDGDRRAGAGPGTDDDAKS